MRLMKFEVTKWIAILECVIVRSDEYLLDYNYDDLHCMILDEETRRTYSIVKFASGMSVMIGREFGIGDIMK